MSVASDAPEEGAPDARSPNRAGSFIDRDDTIPSATEVRALGLTMILSVVVTMLAIGVVTLLGS